MNLIFFTDEENISVNTSPSLKFHLRSNNLLLALSFITESLSKFTFLTLVK